MDPAVSKALDRFNSQWLARYALFRRYVPPPHWAPGLIISPVLRCRYEQYLPVGEFLHDIRKLARHVLPHSSWIPFNPRWPLGCSDTICPFQSLLDLWQSCPPHFAGKLQFNHDQLVPFLCSLADPPRFGTDTGRYPEQLRFVKSFFKKRSLSQSVRILDLGCGTAHGLLELVDAAMGAGFSRVSGLGVTLFPLEAWMATTRTLPHDPRRTCSLRSFDHVKNVHVIAADSLAVPTKAVFDLIVCNGLVGGRFLNSRDQMQQLLHEVRRLLAPSGLFTVASRFHDGWRSSQSLFASCACDEGFTFEQEGQNVWILRGKCIQKQFSKKAP